MKYRKDTVRKNLTLTKTGAEMLTVMGDKLPIAQSAIIDKLLATPTSLMLYTYAKTEPGQKYNTKAVSAIMDRLVEFAKRGIATDNLRKLQDMIPVITCLLTTETFCSVQTIEEICEYVTANMPKRLLENPYIKEFYNECSEQKLTERLTRTNETEQLIINLNANIIKIDSDEKYALSDMELACAASIQSMLIENLTELPHKNYEVIFKLMYENGIMTI